MIYATTWMKVGNVMLSERKSDTEGHTLYDFLNMKHPE